MTVARPPRPKPTQLDEALRVLAILDLLIEGVRERTEDPDTGYRTQPSAREQAELLKVAQAIAARTVE